MEEDLAALRERAGAADVWDDPESARKLMQRLNDVQGDVERWRGLSNRIFSSVMAPRIIAQRMRPR